MGRIRLFPLLFQNGCSQSSRFLTADQRERGSGNEIGGAAEIVLIFKRKNITLELKNIESNNSASARTIQLAKTGKLER